MLFLRLKQAESAIVDGRLDEAFDIVQSEQIKQHRRGQKLIGRLARAFTKRGQENLDTERIQLALVDCTLPADMEKEAVFLSSGIDPD